MLCKCLADIFVLLRVGTDSIYGCLAFSPHVEATLYLFGIEGPYGEFQDRLSQRMCKLF